MKFFLLINVKMPTVVGILTFMSRKNSILSLSEPLKSQISWYLYTYVHLKVHAHMSWAWKKFYNLRARTGLANILLDSKIHFSNFRMIIIIASTCRCKTGLALLISNIDFCQGFWVKLCDSCKQATQYYTEFWLLSCSQPSYSLLQTCLFLLLRRSAELTELDSLTECWSIALWQDLLWRRE